MDLAAVLTSVGGTSGLAAAVAYTVTQWRKSKLDEKVQTRAGDSMTVTDAATANAILVKSLQELRDENGRMARKMRHLEDEALEKDRLIADLRRDMEALKEQMRAADAKLRALEERE